MGQHQVSAVCLGMSGFASLDIDSYEVARALSEIFETSKVIVTSDMASAHFAHFAERNGVIVVVGTGSLAFGLGENAVARIDGLGASLGDLGSAHWIGMEAMRRAKREAELAGTSELLFEIEQFLGASSSWPARLARREITTFDIAKLAQIVDSMTDNGLSSQILTEAGALAAQSAIACASKVEVSEVGFGGSVLALSERMRGRFVADCRATGLLLSPMSHSSGFGAAELAANFDSERVEQFGKLGLARREEF